MADDADMLRSQTAELNPVETDLEAGQHPGSQSEPEMNMDIHPRRRRSLQYDSDNNNALYTIEVLVAYDSAMAAYHGDKVKEYVLTLMSIASIERVELQRIFSNDDTTRLTRVSRVLPSTG